MPYIYLVTQNSEYFACDFLPPRRVSSLLSAISFRFNSMCKSTPSSYDMKYHLKMNFVKDQGYSPDHTNFP